MNRLCRHFGACGGCSALHVPYPRQLEEKQRQVLEIFGGRPEWSEGSIRTIEPAPEPFFYRNKLLYPLAVEHGRIAGGFFARGSHELVDVEECRIQDPAITAVARHVKTVITDLGLPVKPLPGVASEDSPGAKEQGAAVRALAVRVGQATGEVLVGIVTTGGLFERGRRLADAATRIPGGIATHTGRRAKVVGVVRNMNDRETNVVLGPRSTPLSGRDYFVERVGSYQFKISLNAFFQPNARFARRAVQAILRFAGRGGRAVDLYAGVGFISIPLAAGMDRVDAIEESAAAVRDARDNARLNGCDRVEFHEGDASEAMGRLAQRATDLLVVDPPRGGLDPAALRAVLSLGPEKIAYLSCAPASLRRDLDTICKEYEVVEIRPYDFLPHTEHVEILALARRRRVAV
jgi:23S rRNA (uracil1939-C5)-methyltransferase